MFGLGSTMLGDWFDNVFTYKGDNKSLQGFLNAIVLVCETGFALAGFIGVILNLFIPQELDENDEADHMIDDEVVENSSNNEGSSDEKKLDEEKKLNAPKINVV